MSLVDIYDSEMNLLGTAMLEQAHKEGLWHKNFHCWIVANGKVWLQKRSTVDFFPNKFDISAAGHLEAGETPKQAGCREIEEELGFEVDENNFEKMFTYKTVINIPNKINCEFCPTYALLNDWDIADAILAPDEVAGLFEANLEDLIELFANEKESIEVSGMLNDGEALNTIIKKEDFVPRGDSYYLKVFTALDRMIN